MKVYWKHKWLAIPYHGNIVVLQDISPALHDDDLVVVLLSVQYFSTDQSIEASFPYEILSLLVELKVVFTTTTTMPPKCACDHKIPLYPRSQG